MTYERGPAMEINKTHLLLRPTKSSAREAVFDICRRFKNRTCPYIPAFHLHCGRVVRQMASCRQILEGGQAQHRVVKSSCLAPSTARTVIMPCQEFRNARRAHTVVWASGFGPKSGRDTTRPEGCSTNPSPGNGLLPKYFWRLGSWMS
jgi:hypothetical protein